MRLNDKIYDRMTWIARFFLPGIGALYFALAEIWGMPFGAEVTGTVSALVIFLNTILGISSANYEGDGTIIMVGDHDSVVDINAESKGKEQVLLNLKVKE